jgi:hypothetical protein
MSFIDKIGNFIGKGFLKDVGDVVDKFVTTGQEKEEMKRLMAELVHKQEMELQRFSLEAEQEFNKRIKDLEGTAADLNQSGFLGKVIIFFRGLQRPLWGFGVMFMDFQVFSGKWVIQEGTRADAAFYIINFLVLGFLFGERAVKNVAPLVSNMMKKPK